MIRFKFLIIGLLLYSLNTFGDDGTLKHRAYLGMGYKPITREDMASKQLPDMSGVIISRIVPGGPAELYGIHEGDVLKKIDDQSVDSIPPMLDVLRKNCAGDAIAITLLRQGKPETVKLMASAYPEEKAEGLDIEYTCFTVNSVKLRAVVTSPAESKGKQLPAVLFVSAISSPQIIGVSFYSQSRNLAYDVAKAGFRVLRFELRGFGDSEGENYHVMDFNSEVEDNLAALDYLLHRSDVDAKRVFIYGHSTGGMETALLAGKRPVAGLAVSCTVGRTFYERMADTLRLQGKLAGDTGSAIDSRIKNYLHFAFQIAAGESKDTLRKTPEFAAFFNTNERIMDDRTVEFWRQQLNLNLAEVYSQVKSPVLILSAASDYLTQLACHEEIRDGLIASGNKDVTLEIIPGMDHSYSMAEDFKAAYKNYETGHYQENKQAGSVIINWLRTH